MWSHSTGAEVMKPLATPVLGGMVSSLLHVLIVTPVIFYWLRERELRRGGGGGMPSDDGALDGRRRSNGRRTQCLTREGKQLMQRVIVGVMASIVLLAGFSRETVWGAELKVIQTQKTKDVVVTLLSESGQWNRGRTRSSWSSRRRRPSSRRCGQGHLSTSMPMPGWRRCSRAPRCPPTRRRGAMLGRSAFPKRGTASHGGLGRTGRKGSTQFSVSVR